MQNNILGPILEKNWPGKKISVYAVVLVEEIYSILPFPKICQHDG
jgi:hypothetical protein